MSPTLEKPLEIKLSAALVLVIFQKEHATGCDVTAMVRSRRTHAMYAYACDELRSCRLHYPEDMHQGSLWINKASFDVTELDLEKIRTAFPTMLVYQKQVDARQVKS